LEDQLRDAIRTSRLAAGERLPSSRSLASSLGLSRGLVQDCYAQLQAEGYLVGHLGSATRVADAAAVPQPVRTPSPAPAPASRLSADFQAGVPDLGLAPREDWAWAVRQVCRSAPNSAFDYADPAGVPRLTEILAAYLRRVRAIDAQPGQVVVCNGHAQGLALVLRALAQQGYGRVAYEDPGSTGTITAAARAAGSRVVAVPVDEFGIDVAALAGTAARIVVVTPAHQWPTGVVLAPHRRQQLVAWAREHDGIIVEDDYDSEFRYDRDPIGALQGLAPAHVVTLGTVSKSLMPALRLGWAVVPTAFAGEVAGAKRVACTRRTRHRTGRRLPRGRASTRRRQRTRRHRTGSKARDRDLRDEHLPGKWRHRASAVGNRVRQHQPDQHPARRADDRGSAGPETHPGHQIAAIAARIPTTEETTCLIPESPARTSRHRAMADSGNSQTAAESVLAITNAWPRPSGVGSPGSPVSANPCRR
jgi:DNA-binding transcriptional MocR family regulator